MNELESLIMYFVKMFPQKLGRTKLIKAVYLLDCEWYRIHGSTFTGLKYLRDNNGPFDTSFYKAKDSLISNDMLQEVPYTYLGGSRYEFHLGMNAPDEIEFNGMAKCIADDIILDLQSSDLNSFLERAYSTKPMLSIQTKESERGEKCYGEVLEMEKLKRSPKPLFSLKQVKQAAQKLDFTPRGSDEEYAAVVNEEIEQLRVFRERASESWKLIQ